VKRLSLAVLLLGMLFLGVSCRGTEEAPAEVRVPILLYHHFSEEAGDGTVTPGRLREHLTALTQAGYTPVFLEDLMAYATTGTPLPEKPVLLMSDDGYASALDVAMPILSEFSAPLAVAVIGCSFGKDTYKDTEMAMIPHFGKAEAEAAMESGLLSLVSHSFDLHMVERDALDAPALFRKGALRRDGESPADYEAVLLDDHRRMADLLTSLGGLDEVFAYPYGLWSAESEEILRQAGVICTMTTESRTAVLRQGDRESLRLLPRFTVTEEMTGEALIALIEKE